MRWAVLLVSAVFEAIWASALGMSQGLSQPVPTAVFVLALAVSMVGLGWAVRTIPIGTGYAVWVGVGATLTVAYAMLTGAQPVTAPTLVFVAGIIAAVLGLKALSGREARRESPRTPAGDPT